MKKELYDIVIVGGRYLGLVLAGILAQTGYRICIVEECEYYGLLNKRDLKDPDRLFAISLGSIEVLLQNNLIDLDQNIFQPIQKIYVSDNASKGSIVFHPEELGADNFGYMIQETDLLAMLMRNISIYKNIAILDAAQLIDLEENNDGIITLDLDMKNGTQSDALPKSQKVFNQLKARCVIATDGKFSAIRKALKINILKKDYRQIAIVCDIKHTSHHNGIAFERFMPNGPIAVLPKVGGYYSSIVWTEKAEVQKSLLSLSRECIAELIQERLPEEIGQVTIESSVKYFPLFLQKTEEFFCGNIVFAGDALHAMHPLAGQGLNLGIRDAVVLSNLIKENLELGLEASARNAFAKYRQLRSLDIAMMMGATDFLNCVFSTNLLSFKVARGVCMQAIAKSSFIKNKFMHYATYGSFRRSCE